MRFRAILMATLLVAATVNQAEAQQQTGSLVVRVRNKMSGAPLSGAQVSVVGTRLGAVSNEQGNAQIAAVPAGTHVVSISFLGFSEVRQRDVAITAGQATALDISMEEAVLSLQEIVVSATVDPTTGIKAPFTVSKVKPDQLQVPSTNSALASIQGKVAGVNIVRASGQPGAGVNILLRTPTSFEGSNSPLFVVDGVVIARDLDTTTGDIEALEIESVEIIKGAAAASLYGSRAAAGVVSIKTKRGSDIPRGATRMTTRMEFGQDFLSGEQPVTTAHHYQMNSAGTALINAAGRDTTWSGRVVRTVAAHGGAARMMDQKFPGQVYDNIDALYNPDRYLSQQFTLSQNTDNTSFLIGLTRLDQRGALEGNDGFWRNIGRVAVDHRVGNKASFSLTANHSRTRQDVISGDPFEAILEYPVYVDLSQRDENGKYLMVPDPTVAIENPVWRQATRDHYDARARTQASLSARFSPRNWITFDAQMSYDRADTKEQEYVPKGVPTSVTSDVPAVGNLVLETQENNAYNGAVGTTLMRTFGGLVSRLSLRGTFEREWRETVQAEGEDFLVEKTRDLSAARTLVDMSSSTTDIRSNGYYADLALDYNDRYIGSFLIRRDGSSLFGPLNRWHTYKRASAAYLISREDWFRIPGIDELKLRYAMGEAGGRPGYTAQYEQWDVSRTSGLTRGTAGNPSLKPQFTREHDFGIDLIALNNRLQLELVYARQTTRDQIIIVPATVISGYSSVNANAAVVDGRTYEATLTVVPINRNSLRWTVDAVFDNSRTTLKEWNRSCFWGSNSSEGREHERTCAGERAGDFWMQHTVRSKGELPSWLQARADEFDVNDDGYLVWVGKKADGTANSWRDGVANAGVAAACSGSAGTISGGCGWGSSFSANGNTYRWGEPFRGWDEVNNEVQRTLMGSSLPDLGFGFNSNLRYKGLSTYLGFRGQLGGKIYNGARQWLYDEARHGDVDQSEKPDEEKKTIDYYQRGLANGDSGFIDEFLESGTFLKLAEARVAYRFNKNQLQKVLRGAAPTDLTLGVNGRNLHTWTSFKAFDPERGTPLSRIVGVGYPHLRNLTVTLDITF